jgi:hypothetical protein
MGKQLGIRKKQKKRKRWIERKKEAVRKRRGK